MKKTSTLEMTSAIALAAVVTGTALAQNSTLYVTDGDSARLAIVQNGTATIMRTHVRGYPLTVDATVWIGDYNGSQQNTIEYDLAGNATGNTGAYSAVRAVDASTDGTIAYELGNAFNASSTVYSLSKDLSGTPTALFNVSGNDIVGITYDTASGNLWISDRNNIYEYTTGGALVSQFAHSSGRGCIAYEAATDTIWYVTNGSNNITQYDKTGNLLQTLVVSGLASNNWGAEFQFGGTPSFYLRVSGMCPGRITVTWSNGTPGVSQGLVFGDSLGQSTIPNNRPCAGTVLGISGNLRLVDPPGIFGNQGGNGSISGNAGTAACGHYLQLVEGGTCQVSNPARIP